MELYLEIYDYSIQNVSFVSEENLNHVERKLEFYHAQDLIVLSASDISPDPEIISAFLDAMIKRNIRVISILDKIQMHTELFYLRRYEKMLFMSSAILKGKKKVVKSGVIKSQTNIKKKVRVAIYCRVSTREQATLGYSIENQKSKNLMYLQLFDYEIEHIEFYLDKGASAGSLNRKEMQRMLEDIEDGKIDEVIVYKLDRLSRNVLDVYELLQMFLANDVNLVAVLDNLDIKTANGRMVLGILAIFAQWERETVIERTNDGLLQMVGEGKYPKTGCPFGYKKNEDKFLQINDAEADIVIKIFFWAKCGYTFTEISSKVKEVYKIELKPFRVKSIIMEDGYFGQFKYKGMLFEDVMDPIISEADSKEARKMVGKRSFTYGKEQIKFYYRNKVKCNTCGQITGGIPTYKKEKRYYYYYCNKCNKRINQDRIIEMTLLDILMKVDENLASHDLKQALNQIKEIEKKLKSTARKYSEDKISETTYDIAITELDAKLRKEKSKFGSTKIKQGLSWSELSDPERRGLVEDAIVTMNVDLDEKKIIDIEFK